MKYLFLILLVTGCASVNIDCTYYKIDQDSHVLRPVCVEEREGQMPVHRTRQP